MDGTVPLHIRLCVSIDVLTQITLGKDLFLMYFFSTMLEA